MAETLYEGLGHVALDEGEVELLRAKQRPVLEAALARVAVQGELRASGEVGEREAEAVVGARARPRAERELAGEMREPKVDERDGVAELGEHEGVALGVLAPGRLLQRRTNLLEHALRSRAHRLLGPALGGRRQRRGCVDPAPRVVGHRVRETAVHVQRVARRVSSRLDPRDARVGGADHEGQGAEVEALPRGEGIVALQLEQRVVVHVQARGRVAFAGERRRAHSPEGVHLEQAWLECGVELALQVVAQRVGGGPALTGDQRDDTRQRREGAALRPAAHHRPKTGRARKPWITSAFAKSMKKAPMSGTTRNAWGEGPWRCVTASMFAMAVGVAPIPKPQ